MRSHIATLLALLAGGLGLLACGDPGEDEDPTSDPVLRGRVLDAVARTGLADVLIQTEPATSEALTDEAGAFVLEEGLSVGLCLFLRASREGYLTSTSVVSDLHAGRNTAADILLEPVAATSLSGRVLDAETSAPVAGALIRTEPVSGQVTTDALGAYRLEEGLVVGESYRITASHPGYADNAVSVYGLSPGGNTVADILLARRGPQLVLSGLILPIPAGDSQASFGIANGGDPTKPLQFSLSSPDAWVTQLDPETGAVTTGEQTVTVRIDRSRLPEGEDAVGGSIDITSNGGSGTILLQVAR